MKSKKAIITILTVTSILCTCSCGMFGGQKLYTEEEFLDTLEKKYDADFKIIDSDNKSKRETVYTVIIKDEPDIEFEVRNYLTASSEIGPDVNRIECNELMYYFISEYAYEGYVLDRDGELDSDYYVLPKLDGSDSYDGKYSVDLTSEDGEVIVTVMSGANEVFVFSAGEDSEFRGICWDKNNYDLWLQYKDGVLICYHMSDETWELDDGADKPDYIVYNIHPSRK